MSTTETQALSGITVSDATTRSPDDRAWKVAVECLHEGQSATSAAPQVYDALPEPRTLVGVAIIIGAIYATRFWSGTQLDPEKLAQALCATKMWGLEDCRKAARVAFQTWHGLWLRPNFTVPAQFPKEGNVLISPDVATAGPQQLSRAALIQNWFTQYNAGAVVGTNYASARAQSLNLPVKIHEARVRLYWADTGLTVPPPARWREMTAASDDADVLQETRPGPVGPGRQVASGPFEFRPPHSGHYCMLALASTEFFDNPVPTTSGNFDLQAWLKNDGAAAWCNLDVSGTVGQSALHVYNHDDRPGRFVIEAHCSGLAEGTVVEIASDAGLTASGEAGGRARVVRTGVVELPAKYAGEITVRAGDAPLPPGASIDVRQVWVLDRDHPDYAAAVAQEGAHQAAAKGEPVRLDVGGYTYVGRR